MPSLLKDFDNFSESLKGAINATRMRMVDDPEKRRELEERLLRKRMEEEGRKSIPEGLEDSIRSRDADEGLDPRRELDPGESLRRRMEQVDGPQARLIEDQQRVRELVAKHQQGEKLSRDEKILVFEVVYDAIKGLSQNREKILRDKFGEMA